MFYFIFLSIYLPRQISFAIFEKTDGLSSGLGSADSLRRVHFHGACEHNLLTINVTKSPSAIILIIMPDNGFFSDIFCNYSHTSFQSLVHPGFISTVGGKRRWLFSNPGWQVSISVTLSPQGDGTGTWVSISNLTLILSPPFRSSSSSFQNSLESQVKSTDTPSQNNACSSVK